MSKQTKIWLLIAAVLVLLGCSIFVGVMSVLKWDFRKISTTKFETNSYELSDSYDDILISGKTANVVLIPSDNDQTKVVCYEQKNAKHSVSIQDGTLSVELADSRKWYDYIGISFDTPQIAVYLPRGEYGVISVKSGTGKVEIPEDFQFDSMDIALSTGQVKNYASVKNSMKLKTTTGSILVENVSAGAMELTVSTGRMQIRNVLCDGDVRLKCTTGETCLADLTCRNLQAEGSTGDLSMTRVIMTGRLDAERSTGDIKLDSCDASEINIETSTGHVRGSLLSEKVFAAESDTGRVDVPRTVAGGRCEITTNTGDIQITLN